MPSRHQRDASFSRAAVLDHRRTTATRMSLGGLPRAEVHAGSPGEPRRSYPRAAAPSRPRDEGTPGTDAEAAGNRLVPGQVRGIFRLIQCPNCGRPLREPVTLPCGRSICKACLPETHRRTNISYPGTVGRLEGFACPFPACRRDHAAGDCAVDVTLNKAMTVVHHELEQACADTGFAPETSVTVTETEPGRLLHIVRAGRHLGVEVSAPSPVIPVPPSRFLAMYRIARLNLLRYDSDVSFDADLESSFASERDVATIERVKSLVRMEMDCQVCYALFYDPLTTPCGHTFCRHCLGRVADHAPHCPVCRRVLSVHRLWDRDSCPPNHLLAEIASAFWSDTVEQRRMAVLAEARHADGRVPVFVCTLSFPSMPTFLHVFEARYRLMIRRALEGDRTFGMVLYRRPGSTRDLEYEDLGTLLRITNVEFLPDGRSLLETMGVSRFRIRSSAHVDGYLVAETECINDISIAEEEELEARETRAGPGQDGLGETGPATAAPTLPCHLDGLATRELMNFAREFVLRMRALSVDWLATRMLSIYGNCPDDPAVFPWWFASILPLNDHEKYRLLATTSVRERLKICCQWVLNWEERRW